jgi:hypothetical protein
VWPPEDLSTIDLRRLVLEIVAYFSSAAEMQGDAPLHDEEGYPTAHFQAMGEASAAMFKLHQALGFPPAGLIAARTSDPS